MIKKIHFIWFGTKIPDSVKANIKKIQDDYKDFEFMVWNEENYKSKNAYFNGCIREKKYAHAADYARMDILNKHGGIYVEGDQTLTGDIEELVNQFPGKAILCKSNSRLLSLGFVYSPMNSEVVRDIMNLCETNTDHRTINSLLYKQVKVRGWKNQLYKDAILLAPHYLTFSEKGKPSYGEQLYLSTWKGEEAKPGKAYDRGKRIAKRKILFTLLTIFYKPWLKEK